jgi:isoleucyl-tRNA synthetase
VREVCSAAHSIRKANGLRARLPLAKLTVAAADAARLAPYTELIGEEVNVKSVVLTEDEDRFASRHLTVVFKVAAPRLGPATQATATAAKNGDWELLDGGRAQVGASILEPAEFELRVQAVDETTTRALSDHSGLVVLDVNPSDDLVREGLARDLVRVVQQHRRQLGLDVTDRIRLEVGGAVPVVAALEAHGAWIAEQVLAKEWIVVDSTAGDGWLEATLSDQAQAAIRITRLPPG